MKTIVIAAVVGLALATSARSQVQKAAVAVDVVDAVVTVTKVDAKARTVTVRGPKGGTHTLDVPKEAQNLDRVKPGSVFRVRYVEAAAIALMKPGEPTKGEEKIVQLAPKGATPGGLVARVREIEGVVEAIDLTNRQIALRGPRGNVVSLKATEDVKLENVKVGERIGVAYAQALAMQMVEEAPAKPAAERR